MIRFMRNWPDIFPIRYAVILNFAYGEEEGTAEEKLMQEVIFREFIIRLQRFPLTKNDLCIHGSSLLCQQAGINSFSIAKYGGDYEWAKSAKEKINQIIPEIKIGYSIGEFFKVGLCSYRGTGEIPCFYECFRVASDKKNDIEKHNVLGEKFGYWGGKRKVEYLYAFYQKLMKRETKEWELWELQSQHSEPIYVTSPLSILWEFLDKRGSYDDKDIHEGLIPNTLGNRRESCIKLLEEDKQYNSKIRVGIFRNWESLFVEEINQLYKNANFCANCTKALPFKWRGKYCPDISENKDCIRERARKRKSQKRV